MSIQITGPADIRDQRWLDDRIAAIDDGIDSVLDIARNWTEGRNLSRLHPGMSAQDYILSRVSSPLGRGVVVPLLEESNWSNRQIAAVAGVGHTTVNRAAHELDQTVQLARPIETLGSDGKLRRRQPEPTPTPEVQEEASDDIENLNAYYVKALREYVADVVNVLPSGLVLKSPPTLFRKRHALARALDRTIDEALGL